MLRRFKIKLLKGFNLRETPFNAVANVRKFTLNAGKSRPKRLWKKLLKAPPRSWNSWVEKVKSCTFTRHRCLFPRALWYSQQRQISTFLRKALSRLLSAEFLPGWPTRRRAPEPLSCFYNSSECTLKSGGSTKLARIRRAENGRFVDMLPHPFAETVCTMFDDAVLHPRLWPRLPPGAFRGPLCKHCGFVCRESLRCRVLSCACQKNGRLALACSHASMVFRGDPPPPKNSPLTAKKATRYLCRHQRLLYRVF